MKKSELDINEIEKLYWNERLFERTKIKKLRRHSFHFSYKEEKRIIKNLSKSFENKELLEIGSYTWPSWISNNVIPKRLTCINIAQGELDLGLSQAKNISFEIKFELMDANNLTFPDNSFDVVYGGAILHHLDIKKTIGHIHRVLRPGGIILFLEPLNRNPLYRIYRWLNPNERTPDEHALVNKDMMIINKKFKLKPYYFDFFTVIFGFISLRIFGDKYYDNWLNKFGFRLDKLLAKFSIFDFLFARVILYGIKEE